MPLIFAGICRASEASMRNRWERYEMTAREDWNAIGRLCGFCPICALEGRPYQMHKGDCETAKKQWDAEQKKLRDEIAQDQKRRGQALASVRQKKAGAAQDGRGGRKVYLMILDAAVPYGEDQSRSDFTPCVYVGVASDPGARMRLLRRKWAAEGRIADDCRIDIKVLTAQLTKAQGHAMERQLIRMVEGAGPPMMNVLRFMTHADNLHSLKSSAAKNKAAARHEAEHRSDEEILLLVPADRRRCYDRLRDALEAALLSGRRLHFCLPPAMPAITHPLGPLL